MRRSLIERARRAEERPDHPPPHLTNRNRGNCSFLVMYCYCDEINIATAGGLTHKAGRVSSKSMRPEAGTTRTPEGTARAEDLGNAAGNEHVSIQPMEEGHRLERRVKDDWVHPGRRVRPSIEGKEEFLVPRFESYLPAPFVNHHLRYVTALRTPLGACIAGEKE